jgi:membrane protease YdiL (CAAX protease family)
MTHWGKDSQGRHNFWSRVIDFRRISGRWYPIIFLIFPVTLTIAGVIYYLYFGQLPSLDVLFQLLANPLALISAVVVGLITGPLSEELGWRGYAQDQFQKRWSPLLSSLILAPFWWGWHLPLFFMRGTTHYQWGVGTIHFWLFLAGIFPLVILLAWAYNHNGRSILAAVLLHFMCNFTLSLVHPMSETLHTIYTFLLAIAALSVVTLFGCRR